MKLSPSRIASSLFCAGLALLSVFSSAAQASWSVPVYTITARQPTAPDITTTYAPGGGGFRFAGKSFGGTAKTTFTWVHDVPGDAPPTDVYVLQSGYASWLIHADPPPAPAAQELSRPSIQNAFFSLQHKPRIYLAQAQGGAGSGTADDGLGDAQVVATDAHGSLTGLSKGDKVIVCHPCTDGTLIVPTVTLIAKATPSPPKPPATTRYFVCYYSYSA